MNEKLRIAMFGQKRLSREGGIEIVVKELATRMVQNVPTIEKKGLAAVSASFFASLYCAFGKYDVVHIHAEGPAFFCWIPKLFGKKVIVTVHGI